MFSGVREDPSSKQARETSRASRPVSATADFINPKDAEREGLRGGDWVALETAYGEVRPSWHQAWHERGHLRVPMGGGIRLRGKEALGGAFISSDAVLCSDDDEFLDHEQFPLQGYLDG